MFVVLSVLLLQCLVVSCAYIPVVFDEIYDGEHLRDILFSDLSGVTARHAVLIFYTPLCKNKVDFWRLLHDHLEIPDDYYLYFAVHDFETAEKYTWYKPRATDNLTSWYDVSSPCSTTVFLPKGSTEKTKPKVMSDRQLFQDWIWNQVKVKVTLINKASESVTFGFNGFHEVVPDVIVEAGHQKVIAIYTSYLMTATGDSGFYGGWTIGFNSRNVTVCKATPDMNQAKFISEQRLMMENRRKKLDAEVWDYTDRHLLNRKQPLLVQNFTTSGYKKLLMPDWLKHQLQEFYYEQADFREAEEWTPSGTLINMKKNRCGMVQLDNATKAVVASGIQPLLEEWCNCSLKMTAFYGIREYYKGHRLKNHVDRVETHVISVILQIQQDLDGAEDWLLELINYEGERENCQLKAGEMLFYESARLIHGRPKIFQGKLMANAFLHFRPTEGWLFSRPPNGNIYHNGKSLASMYPLPDARTFSELEKRVPHTLWHKASSVRDEL